MNKYKTLSRAEMKNVMGGVVYEEEDVDDNDSGGGDDNYAGGSPKINACRGKSRYASCSFKYKGTTYSGRCDAHMASELYCSTLM